MPRAVQLAALPRQRSVTSAQPFFIIKTSTPTHATVFLLESLITHHDSAVRSISFSRPHAPQPHTHATQPHPHPPTITARSSPVPPPSLGLFTQRASSVRRAGCCLVFICTELLYLSYQRLVLFFGSLGVVGLRAIAWIIRDSRAMLPPGPAYFRPREHRQGGRRGGGGLRMVRRARVGFFFCELQVSTGTAVGRTVGLETEQLPTTTRFRRGHRPPLRLDRIHPYPPRATSSLPRGPRLCYACFAVPSSPEGGGILALAAPNKLVPVWSLSPMLSGVTGSKRLENTTAQNVLGTSRPKKLTLCGCRTSNIWSRRQVPPCFERTMSRHKKKLPRSFEHNSATNLIFQYRPNLRQHD
jgi:hypothetical protein